MPTLRVRVVEFQYAGRFSGDPSDDRRFSGEAFCRIFIGPNQVEGLTSQIGYAGENASRTLEWDPSRQNSNPITIPVGVMPRARFGVVGKGEDHDEIHQDQFDTKHVLAVGDNVIGPNNIRWTGKIDGEERHLGHRYNLKLVVQIT